MTILDRLVLLVKPRGLIFKNDLFCDPMVSNNGFSSI